MLAPDCSAMSQVRFENPSGPPCSVLRPSLVASVIVAPSSTNDPREIRIAYRPMIFPALPPASAHPFTLLPARSGTPIPVIVAPTGVSETRWPPPFVSVSSSTTRRFRATAKQFFEMADGALFSVELLHQ